MTNATNIPAEATISESPEVVRVDEFRRRISHLENLVSSGRHSCVGAAERQQWVKSARRIGSELINTTCLRATAEDWRRRERAIDRSTSAIDALDLGIGKVA